MLNIIKAQLKKRPQLAEIIRFGLVGLTALIIHYGLYYLFLKMMNVNLAFSLGYFISLTVNFLLNSFYTFSVKPTAKKGVGFLFSHAVNYLLQITFLNIFLKLGLSDSLAPIPVFAICIPVNLLLVRFFMKR